MEKYYITSSGETTWTETKATTLIGAKSLASKAFMCDACGNMRVGYKNDCEDFFCEIQTVAVKYGYNKWVNVI